MGTFFPVKIDVTVEHLCNEKTSMHQSPEVRNVEKNLFHFISIYGKWPDYSEENE